MKHERAIEILDPAHRERFESLAPVNEACRLGMAALERQGFCVLQIGKGGITS